MTNTHIIIFQWVRSPKLITRVDLPRVELKNG